MKLLRASALVLLPLWIAACATATDSATGLVDAAGASQSPAGAAGALNSFGGAGGRLGGGAGSPSAGSPSAGSPSTAGQGNGQAGASARGGAGGSAGSTGGSGGSGGGGAGAPPVFEAGACAETPTMSLQYKQNGTQQAVIAALYQFTNTSDTPVPVASLSIRYFFSNEKTSAWKPMVYDAHIDGGTGGYRNLSGSTLKVVALGSKAEGADSYAELTFSAAATLEKGATAQVSWDLQPGDYNLPIQIQTNDYSYNGAATAYTVWDHIAVYQGATLVFGCLPKAADGSAGAGGAAGGSAGGAGGAAAGAGGAAAGAGGAATGAGGAATGAGGAAAGAAGTAGAP